MRSDGEARPLNRSVVSGALALVLERLPDAGREEGMYRTRCPVHQRGTTSQAPSLEFGETP